MNIIHLKYAVEVARTGSINKAAENLFIGQPNLSRAIKDLESSLGIVIFERSAKGMVVTNEGEVFLDHARSILERIEEVEQIYRLGVPVKQRFSVSVPRTTYIAEAFIAFTKALDPSLQSEIFYKETNAMRAINNILHTDYKLGIIRFSEKYDNYFFGMLNDKGLTYDTIAEFARLVLISKQNPLSEKEILTSDDLGGYVEIAFADPYVPAVPYAEVIKEEVSDTSKRRIYIYDRASQFELLTENTDTFMLAPPLTEELLEKHGLVQRELVGCEKKYRDLLIKRKNYRFSPLDELFLSEINKSKDRFFV